MKKTLIFLLSGFMLLATAGCNNAEESNVLSIAFGGGTPLTLDPALNSASNGSNIIKLTDCGLMGYNKEGKIDCELAKSYTVSSDGKTYTFKLRDNLKWSDGSSFSASDIVKAWERAASDALGADYGFLYSIFEGYDDGKINVTADDSSGTVTCKLNYNAPYFLDLCAFPVFFPVKTDVADSEGVWAIDPSKHIGMGAFRMTSYAVDDCIQYEKNPNYWNASEVKLDGVKCWLSEDNAAILTNYENGTTQLINSIAPEEFDRLKAVYGSEFVIADQMGTWYILFNVYKDMSPVGGKQLTVQEQCDVREALGLLINREEIVNEVYVAGEKAATGFYPTGLSDGLNDDVRSSSTYGTWYTGTNPSSENAKYTVDQVAACKQLIASGFKYTGSIEGGDIKFQDVPSVEFSINNSGANALIVTYIQECWNTFGIEAKILQDAWATLQAELKKGNAEAARMGWVADFNDVTNFIEIFISASGNNYPRLGRDIGSYSKATETTKDAGVGAYWGENGNQTWAEAFDALDKQILYSTDKQQRAELAAKAEKVIMDTGTVCPIYFYTNPYMCKSNVTGVNVLITGDIIVTYAEIA